MITIIFLAVSFFLFGRRTLPFWVVLTFVSFDDLLIFRGLLDHPERFILGVLLTSIITALIPILFLLCFCPRVRKQS